MEQQIGKVISISGPAIDVQFEEGHMPPIYQALRIVSEGFDIPNPLDVVVEVQQHLGEGRVRCIAMVATEGMVRGMKAIDTGGGITVPVGRETLGRVLNVLGEPVDELGPVNTKERRPIHRQAPAFDEQSTSEEMFETGIKVVDLILPFLKGGKIGLFGGAGRRQNRRHPGTDQQRRPAARRLLRLRRRRRAHPRGQRSLERVSGVRSHRHPRLYQEQSRPHLRPDDRAPGARSVSPSPASPSPSTSATRKVPTRSSSSTTSSASPRLAPRSLPSSVACPPP